MAKILIVDDSETVRSELTKFIEQQGHEPYTASDGQEGLKVAQDNELLDVMFIDVNMPVMDGLVMVEKVRQLDAHKNTFIFMLTTESDKKLIAKAKTLGVVAWMLKPCHPMHMKRGIDKVLSSQAATEKV
jgi:two-component system, chemotaxis family, chemotaxis protein CheY